MDYKVADEEALLNNQQKTVSHQMRLGFIRKVYGILSIQLVMTTLLSALSFIPSVKGFLLTHIGLFYLVVILSICLAIPLICCQNIARKVPTNYILLFSWTLCESYMVATCCALFDPKIVIAAAAITSAIVISLTVYACTTKTDFTFSGGILFVCCTLLILLGIFSIFLPFLHTLYCVLGVFLFSIYLIFDTQLVMGKFGNEFSAEDYIVAAMNIYIDIIQIFIYILELLGSRRN